MYKYYRWKTTCPYWECCIVDHANKSFVLCDIISIKEEYYKGSKWEWIEEHLEKDMYEISLEEAKKFAPKDIIAEHEKLKNGVGRVELTPISPSKEVFMTNELYVGMVTLRPSKKELDDSNENGVAIDPVVIVERKEFWASSESNAIEQLRFDAMNSDQLKKEVVDRIDIRVRRMF